jgi:hypothetical protein
MLAPTATIGGLALATLALHVRDPHQHGSWGLCPSAVMGFYCPGCGGLRAVNDLTNGDVGAALSSNLLVTLLIPVAIVLLCLWVVDSWRGRMRWTDLRTVRPSAYVFLAVLAAFTVLRNISIGSWLAP